MDVYNLPSDFNTPKVIYECILISSINYSLVIILYITKVIISIHNVCLYFTFCQDFYCKPRYGILIILLYNILYLKSNIYILRIEITP